MLIKLYCQVVLKPSKARKGAIVPFEVIVSHNSRTDRARKSVKTSSDLEDSNAFLRYVARACDVIFGENLFFTLPK